MKRVPIILGLMVLASAVFGELMFQPSWVSLIGAVNPITATTGLVLDLNANTGLTISGTNVEAWADQSGAGNNYAQATANIQPTYQATGLNGKPCVSFNGNHPTGSRLDSTGAQSLVVHTNQTIFIVGQRGLPQNQIYGYFYSQYNNGISKGLVVGFGSGAQEGNINYAKNGGSDTWLTAGTTTNTANVFTFRLNNGLPEFKVYTNSTATVSNLSACAMYATNAVMSIGALNIGGYGANMRLGRILVYNRALTEDEILAINARLKSDWGTP